MQYRGDYWKFSVKKIFFIRKIPRVEPGRAFTHHASVPFMGGGSVNTTKHKSDEVKFNSSLLC
jgi:hypothetical protein